MTLARAARLTASCLALGTIACTPETQEAVVAVQEAAEAAEAAALRPAPPEEATTAWRSVLYPTGWTPGYTTPQGYWIHDFSYAGYHNSEDGFGQTLSDYTIDVVADTGADNTGATDTTATVQRAINIAAEGGGIVYFPPGTYRLDGRLTVTTSNVVLRGAGSGQSKLYFTSSVGMSNQGHITFRGALSSDLEVKLATDGVNQANYVEVASPGALKVGDDIAIGFVITDAFIEEHGMTGTWQAFNGTWQPFFWREITAIDTTRSPARIYVDVPLRYPAKVRDTASIRRQKGYLKECAVEHLGLANAVSWDAAWAQNQVHVLEMIGVKDCWIDDVKSFSPPTAPTTGYGRGAHLQSSGVMIASSKRVTVANSRMEKAENRGGGGNGYLWEIRQSSEILTRDTQGLEGRHNFIQNWGFGVTGCVWLRIYSQGGRKVDYPPLAWPTWSEFHHSLATANLVDNSTFDDGWCVENRRDYSTGAGVTGTDTVIWNTDGSGIVQSWNYKMGYVVGTGSKLHLRTELRDPGAVGTAPEDFVEGVGQATTLEPQSLFEDQLGRRTGG